MLTKYIQGIWDFVTQIMTGNINGLLRAFQSGANMVKKDVLAYLSDYLVNDKINVPVKQRGKLLRKIDKTLTKQAKLIGQKDIEVTTKILEDVAKESYYRTAYIVEAGMDKAIKLKPLKENEIKAIVNTPVKEEMFSDRIWKNKEKLVKELRYSIEQAMLHGRNPRKLAKDIQTRFNVSAYESKRLINNELARVSRQAQDQVYEKMGVKQVMFDATLDEKTSKFCQEHDGLVFYFGEHPKIPEETHVGCRSDIIPLIPGWKPTQKKENIKNEDGVKPVIDYSTYKEWKKERGFK